mmetsp:Transcript_135410/g.433026  ORF Transcript_135410/g.433026 Transcript_135410/m.433026 type:complete len:614 (+) Transcript_135410:45-1886(+)
MVIPVVPPVWGSLKKPLVECVVRVDDALATCFPNTRERLTSAAEGLKATSTQPGGLAQLPLGLGRSLGISLLECTEAMLDALLPLHPSGISLITSSGTAQDVDDEDVEDMPRASAKPRVGPSLPFFRMFAVKLSSGSHTLQVTVISVQDSYSSLLDRLGVHKVWQLLQSLKTVEVRRGICDAARDPPAAAAKATKQAISFLGCERQFASALERMLTTRLAVKLLGARSEQWAAWAHSAGCSGEPLDLPPSTVIVEDVDDFRRPLRALPGLTQLEKDAALAMGLRLVVKNSFIELVPDVQEGEEPASKCARRTRSCGAVLAHTQEREVWIDAAEEVARYPTAGPPPTRLAPPPEPQPPPTPTPTSARSPSPSWPSWHSAAAAAAAVPPAPALTPLAPPAPPAAAAATAQPMTAAASAAAFDEAVAAEAALLDAGKAGAAALAKACGAGGAATEGADEGSPNDHHAPQLADGPVPQRIAAGIGRRRLCRTLLLRLLADRLHPAERAWVCPRQRIYRAGGGGAAGAAGWTQAGRRWRSVAGFLERTLPQHFRAHRPLQEQPCDAPQHAGRVQARRLLRGPPHGVPDAHEAHQTTEDPTFEDGAGPGTALLKCRGHA